MDKSLPLPSRTALALRYALWFLLAFVLESWLGLQSLEQFYYHQIQSEVSLAASQLNLAARQDLPTHDLLSLGMLVDEVQKRSSIVGISITDVHGIPLINTGGMGHSGLKSWSEAIQGSTAMLGTLKIIWSPALPATALDEQGLYLLGLALINALLWLASLQPALQNPANAPTDLSQQHLEHSPRPVSVLALALSSLSTPLSEIEKAQIELIASNYSGLVQDGLQPGLLFLVFEQHHGSEQQHHALSAAALIMACQRRGGLGSLLAQGGLVHGDSTTSTESLADRARLLCKNSPNGCMLMQVTGTQPATLSRCHKLQKAKLSYGGSAIEVIRWHELVAAHQALIERQASQVLADEGLPL